MSWEEVKVVAAETCYKDDPEGVLSTKKYIRVDSYFIIIIIIVIIIDRFLLSLLDE